MRTLLATSCLLLAIFSSSAGAQSRDKEQNADAIDAPRITQQAFKKLVAAHNVVIVDTRRAEYTLRLTKATSRARCCCRSRAA